MTSSEQWKKIENYSHYYVSSFGRIKSMFGNKEKILIQNLKGGYLACSFSEANKKKSIHIHRLVALHFIDNPRNDKIVNHKDGNKCNNKVENLEWMSTKENNLHARETGLHKVKQIKVSQYSLDNKEFIETFNSITEAANKIGIKDSKITSVCQGKRNSAGGFFWKYSDFIYEEPPVPIGKNLENYPNYIITQEGQVYSKKTRRYMALKTNNGGYKVVKLCNDINYKDFLIHRLVAMLYLDNPKKVEESGVEIYKYPMVNHKNLKKDDNRVENLEWCSFSENMTHYFNTRTK